MDPVVESRDRRIYERRIRCLVGCSIEDIFRVGSDVGGSQRYWSSNCHSQSGAPVWCIKS
jgi:hypothetical protein